MLGIEKTVSSVVASRVNLRVCGMLYVDTISYNCRQATRVLL